MTILAAALPTVQFVIGLREGVEAALIVGIVAAFLRRQGRADALRWVWAGVAVAVVLCVGVAVGLEAVNEQLPQRQQEGFEAIIGLVAVAMVTFMIVWMRRHARHLGRDLRESAASALATGSALGLVLMAFLAVLREGIETSVFLLATFQSVGVSAWSAATGAIVGILVAVAIGYGIYRGGVRLNLARFFRVTGVFLVVIAAGLVAGAIHSAHGAGWINVLQTRPLDLSWLIRPRADSVPSGLITGIFGLQAQPTAAEIVGWLAYAVPMLALVLWPPGLRLPGRPRRPVPSTSPSA